MSRDPEGSFRVLFDGYYDLVQGFFAQRVATAEDGLDLTQETFLRVYKGLKGYRGEADFGTWVFRIAFNTHLPRTVLEQHDAASPARLRCRPDRIQPVDHRDAGRRITADLRRVPDSERTNRT